LEEEMQIIERVNDVSVRGDFKAEIINGELVVPTDIKAICDIQGLGNAEEFISFVWSFPGGIIGHLHWSLDEVYSARDKLVNILRGSIPEDYLSAPVPQKRYFGARHPTKP
jgi:hypothetical protein